MKFTVKKSNNPYKVQTAARPADLILHSDTEQIYFIYVSNTTMEP